MTVSVPRTESRRFRVFTLNKRVLLLMLVTIGVVGAIYMGQVSQAALIGQRVNQKQERLSRLLRENVQLEADIASLVAPDKIEARAKALGLHIAKPEQIKYLVVKDYPVQPTRSTQPRAPATPSADEPLWQSLFGFFPISGSRATATPP